MQTLLQWEVISITYSERVFVALVFQHAMHMRRSHLWPARIYTIFSTLYHKRHDFLKREVIEIKICVLVFSATFSEIFLILRRTRQDVIKNVYRYSYKLSVILVRL